MKLSIVIVGAIAIAATVSVIGYTLGIPVWVRPGISATIGVAIMWLFAGGITSPLGAMSRATDRMAQGDYGVRVPEDSRDEVGDLARAFNEMARRLEEVDIERRDLVAMVSHELRTPITALQANLENVVDGIGSTSERTGERVTVDAAHLEAMLRQLERLGRLVDQLLDLSRLESGAAPMTRRVVKVQSVLSEVESEARLQHPQHSIALTVEPPDLTIAADAERLHQSIANLVDNAAKVSPVEHPILVRAAARGDAVRIEVEDRGPGIPESDLGQVFERWHRGAVSRNADHGGTGLGLAIARWVMELHGGTIHAEQADPTGCRMVLELPTAGGRHDSN